MDLYPLLDSLASRHARHALSLSRRADGSIALICDTCSQVLMSADPPTPEPRHADDVLGENLAELLRYVS